MQNDLFPERWLTIKIDAQTKNWLKMDALKHDKFLRHHIKDLLVWAVKERARQERAKKQAASAEPVPA